MSTKYGATELLCALAALSIVCTPASWAACQSNAGATTPVTITDETSGLSTSRQLTNGAGTQINLQTPGKVAVDVVTATAPAPLTIGIWSSGGIFAPSINTFTNVTAASQINLPGTGSVAPGSVIALTIGGSQGATSIMTNGGLNNENIINGGTTTTSMTINNGEVVYLANMGGGNWLVINLNGGPTGVVPITSGGTGATTAPGARSNLSAAASGANGDITSLTGLTTALSVAQGGTGSGTASGARSNLSAAASGSNSDITALSGLTTPLSAGQGGTGQSSYTKGDLLVASNASTLTKVAAGSNGQILSADSGTASGVNWVNPPSGGSGTARVFGGWGGASSLRAIPTSGNLSGPYFHVGNWTSTGAINCNRCSLHVVGTFTLSHALTVSTEIQGGKGAGGGNASAGGVGSGLGGGNVNGGGNGIANSHGGGGGGFGGQGGNGGTNSASLEGSRGGQNYHILDQPRGSSGAGGDSGSANAAGEGGDGGGSLYIEASGAVTVDANITAQGGTGSASAGSGAGSGGGGSGGGVDIRSLGTVTINASRVIDVIGGAGAAGNATTGAAGGGGGGGFIAIHGSTVTNNGTLTVSGGAAGGGTSTTPATAGGSGITLVESVVWPMR